MDTQKMEGVSFPENPSDNELMMALIQEVRNLRKDLRDMKETQEQIMLDANEANKKKELKVFNPNGGPTSVTARILKKAKQGPKENGVDTDTVQMILEDEGFERSRKPVLKFMKKVDREFDNYSYKSGSGQTSSSLHYFP